MDRQITKEEKDLARRKKLIKGGIIGGCVLVVGIIVMSLMRTRCRYSHLETRFTECRDRLWQAK